MAALKKLGAVYLVGVAVAVAVFFIVNTFLDDEIDVLNVWHALDVLMLIALAIALTYNYARKQDEDGGDPGGGVTRRYLEVNVAFYLTAGVMILFLHNWFALLALGADSLDDNRRAAWTIWAVVDTALPIVVGVTGCRLWQEASAKS